MKFKTQKSLFKKTKTCQIELFPAIRRLKNDKFSTAFRLHICTQKWKMAKKPGFRPQVVFSNTLSQ